MINPPVSKQNEQRNDDLIFSYLSKVEDFIITDKQRSETFANYVKHFSDLKCSLLPTSFGAATPLSVHVRGFDSEQIYQQIKSINESRFKTFLTTIIKNKSKQKTFGDLLRPPSPEKPPIIEDDLSTQQQNEEESSVSETKTAKKKKKSVTFFDSNALNKFLDEQDFQEMSKSNRMPDHEDEFDEDFDDDDEDGDLFLDGEEKDATYEAFFDPPSDTKQKKKKKQKNGETEKENEKIHADQVEDDNDEQEDMTQNDDDDDEENLENKSEFERHQIQLRRQIKSIEKEMLSDKPWQLAGEIESHKRPENSLLEEYLQYDRTTRLPPVITTETTDSIEDLIKQRIRDRAFDDVERKTKLPNENESQAYKKEVMLEHEKSKMSLAQVYEQEYMKKQTQHTTEQKDERHENIRKLMQNLFMDLDALSNFRFTPKPPIPEITVVNNLPAIVVEEVVPTTVNDATLLAPEEVHVRPKGDVKAKTERTDTDKKHERRLLKHKLKLKDKQQKKKNPDDNVEEEKRTLLKKLGKMKNVRIEKTDKKHSNGQSARSSKKFFEQLQQSTQIQPTKKRHRVDKTATTDSKRLKL